METIILTEFKKRVKQQLLSRGFTIEKLLNNRGLVGATIDETARMLIVMKNNQIQKNKKSKKNNYYENLEI